MPTIRPELVRGLALLGIFLVVIISSDVLFPYAIKHSEYGVVSFDRLEQNPEPFEGKKISSQVTVTQVIDNSTYIISDDGIDAILVVSHTLGTLQRGERVYIRGTSWILTNNSIVVDEFYILNYTSSLIRSIPGIIIFLVLFFSVFKIDFKKGAFVSRRSQSA